MENILSEIKNILMVYGMKVIAAIIILLAGLWAAKILKKISINFIRKRSIDETITVFVSNLVYTLVIIFVIIATLSQIGVQTASFVAVLGAAGLAIGLALQGALGNFAAGFLLILFRPFKSGDFVEAAGSMGTVQDIQMLYTQLKTPDNKKIIIPNGKLMAEVITNFNVNSTRRIEWIFGVGYKDNLKKVREILQEIISNEKDIHSDPIPQIVVKELGESSVNFAVRVWVDTPNYWNVFFDVTEKVKLKFDEEGINIPFPQRDVHLFQNG